MIEGVSIAEIGHFALILALLVAVVQSVVPLVGAQQGNGPMMALAPSTAVAQLLMLLISFAALTTAFVTSDFSVVNVYQNSHSLKPMLYKVSGVWGNHEGSLLLWVTVLALFGAMVAWFGRNLPPGLKARTLAVQAMISVGFLLFMLLTSNPFDRVFPAPLEGRDLNPLLQDPGLAFHPPMLYIGYVGLSISFSFAVAALIEGKVDAAWARYVRPWTLLAWAFLTGGIGLGSWWAYYELGWGGFWFWDPVENASFMPWLAATALLHSAIVVEKRDTLKSWTILLAIIGFSLSLIGTFLVRSGILTSVHAFASDPDRGVFILLLMILAIGGSLALYAWRAPKLQGGGLFRPVSREGALVLNNLLLTTATATVFVGTLYPIFLEVMGGSKISVGPPFYNMTFVPLVLPLLLALGIGPFLSWKRADLWAVMGRLKIAMAITAVVIAITIVLMLGDSGYAMLGLAFAAWLIVSSTFEVLTRAGLGKTSFANVPRRLFGLPRAAWGMTLAHMGVGVLVAGATGASLMTTEVISVVRPGESVEVDHYQFEFQGLEEVEGPNYIALRGTFHIKTESGDLVSILQPENRRYLASGQQTTEAAIRSGLTRDVYVALGDPSGPDGITVRAYRKPFAPWLWYGTALMMLGGFVSLSDRRLRIGAPKRSNQAGGGTPADVRGSAPAPAE